MTVVFAAIGPFNTGTYVIFTVAAFFALCALIAWFIASSLESSRHDAALRTRLQAEFAARTETPGEASVVDEETPTRHLQWPNDPPADGHQ